MGDAAMRPRRLNIEPFHSEMKYTGNGFEWKFIGETVNGKRHEIVMDFDFWWLSYIARDLWKIINERRLQIKKAESDMCGGE